ncbi:MAG: ricin-type beta-trefoil lectin domain protein [Lewinellaceae bacterium]|nr:ricin-type beta-trefoil lectin domain protein [Saprospiraceae bacterium]MCB9331071.1 ricin-type beta-trefoil lectin domain protein [Lewinellaceae bacterium]
MKKQTFRSTKGFLFLPLMMFFLGMTAIEMQAQSFTVTEEKDIVVPADQDKMYVELQGGDGGRIKLAQGGRGATIRGILNIGTGTGMIKPGGTLRFIAGAAGGTVPDGVDNSGGGGGASGLIYKAPGSSQWDIIAVAAAGGGASVHVVHDNGAVTRNAHDGGQGRVSLADMVDDPVNYAGHKGGSSYSGGDQYSCEGKAGMVNGQPVRATVYSGCGSYLGGAGFGSGGSHDSYSINNDVNDIYYYGGGGGGYFGGYHHNYSSYDNGGGSWTNPTFFSTAQVSANGVTESPQDGYILYSYDMGPIKFTYNTNKCIDDAGSGTSNGNNILSFSCTGNPNQQWVINTSDRTIHAMVDFGKCLDLSSGNTTNGTNIQLWDCQKNNANQKWVYNGLYKTIHSGVNSEKCFDATNGSAYPNSNVNLQLWDCNYTSNNMKWTIDGANTVSDPVHAKFIIPVLAPNFAVHSHTGNVSGSNIQLWTKDPTLYAEYWYFDGLAIKMREYRDLCIDLSQSNTSNGNNIQLYNCNSTNAQKWIYDGMTKSIRSVINPDKCMQIEKNTDGVYGKRSNVDIQDCNGSEAQQFLIQG